MIYGSHSAPLTSTVSTLPTADASFALVGKPAPPMPVIPASRMIAISSSGGSVRGLARFWIVGQSVTRPSFSSTTAGMSVPPGCGRGSTATTVPETDACTGAQSPSPSPSFCPSVTRSPTRTSGLQGAPMCCDRKIVTVFGRIGTGAASRLSSFSPLGWTPPKKARAIALTSFHKQWCFVVLQFHYTIVLDKLPHFFRFVFVKNS